MRVVVSWAWYLAIQFKISQKFLFNKLILQLLLFCRMQEVSQFYRFRPDEIFRRITVTSMVQLMLEQSKLDIQESDQARGGAPISPISPNSAAPNAAGEVSESEDSAVEADMDAKTVVANSEEVEEDQGMPYKSSCSSGFFYHFCENSRRKKRSKSKNSRPFGG